MPTLAVIVEGFLSAGVVLGVAAQVSFLVWDGWLVRQQKLPARPFGRIAGPTRPFEAAARVAPMELPRAA